MAPIDIILYLVLIGVLLWLINSFIPTAPAIKTILNVVVSVVVIIWLLQVFGVMSLVYGRVAVPAAQ